MFLPTTRTELDALGWEQLDVILVSGDTYIDSPYSGIALLGKQLLAHGYKVGIIAQPDVKSEDDILRLGEPLLFWGVSAGAVDSMVANTTALGKPRRLDDFTPGGQNDRRPNRASIVYTNLIRRHFKDTAPIVLGGVEASLRRLAHYDFWTDSLRRSILLDAKADYLIYGLADYSILELAETLKTGGDPRGIRGLVYADAGYPEGYLELPSMEDCLADKDAFTRMFHTFYQNNDPISAQGLAQRFGDRYVVQNPPAPTLTTEQMDTVYGHEFEHALHPYYARQGEVRAMETIRFAIPTHRGCYGECNFCAIAVHEGRRVSWRSENSILNEALAMTQRPGFNGIIYDLSGPTANMYGFECQSVKPFRGACRDKSCIYPNVCPLLGMTHAPATDLMRKLRELPEVKKVFIGSGIRHDMVMQDAQDGPDYMQELVEHHVSGQLRLAPEHSEPWVLRRMRKPSVKSLLGFKERFEAISKQAGKEQYLSYYLIAAHPGCSDADMINLRQFCSSSLGVLPEQVQIFTPTPSTYSSLMYYTEQDPFSGEPLFVEKGLTGKMQQKATITGWRRKPEDRGYQRQAHFAPLDEDWGEEAPRRDASGQRKEGRWDRRGAERSEAGGPPAETRVVRDDYGHFFNNKLPDGYVDKRFSPPPQRRDGPRRGAESRTGSRRTASEGERPPRREFDRPARPETGERKPWERREDRPPGRESDRPARPGTGERKPWERRDERPPRREFDRPARPDTGERKPWERRDERPPRREFDRPARPDTGERKPWERRDERSPRREFDRPARPETGERKPWERRDERSPRRDQSASPGYTPRRGTDWAGTRDQKPAQGRADRPPRRDKAGYRGPSQPRGNDAQRPPRPRRESDRDSRPPRKDNPDQERS